MYVALGSYPIINFISHYPDNMVGFLRIYQFQTQPGIIPSWCYPIRKKHIIPQLYPIISPSPPIIPLWYILMISPFKPSYIYPHYTLWYSHKIPVQPYHTSWYSHCISLYPTKHFIYIPFYPKLQSHDISMSVGFIEHAPEQCDLNPCWLMISSDYTTQ